MQVSSNAWVKGSVTFPAFQGDRIYMLPFFKANGFSAVPECWRETVAMMMDGIETDLPGYLMVDQKRLAPGDLHRRGGIHVDGNWFAASGMHRNPDPYPGHRHPDPAPGPHHIHAGRHGHIHGDYAPEVILLASNIEACKSYIGNFAGNPSVDGDCSHFDLAGAAVSVMQRNRVYRCTATTLHETIPVQTTCNRTVVRVNIPGMN